MWQLVTVFISILTWLSAWTTVLSKQEVSSSRPQHYGNEQPDIVRHSNQHQEETHGNL